MPEAARVQLCGTFAVELSGRRIDNLLPGRQGRLLFAYLALSRLRPVSRSTLVDALWGDDQPANVGGALNALISKTRSVVGGEVLRGRSELVLEFPEPAVVDVARLRVSRRRGRLGTCLVAGPECLVRSAAAISA